ncbi:probable ATP-dependent RNA helicase DDX20 [Erpetoichthys calabaricus]|uniref:probable ATP-dependent RNA helicase DDX20 n=1 Tax=Erpetoichthys calabaricus TaxID=27687 RepID=UPI0022344878|nr:probable ATP-dependent RNA helicase DDX20 [Erpetoichthys calabaricus]
MATRVQKTAHDVPSRRRTDDVFLADKIDFSSLLLSETVQRGLAAAGFQRPSPVQLKAIPLGRCGLDLIVQAKSGTGKTCVFATIALDSLVLENPSIQVLVLAPTREIAVQIHSVITAIGVEMEGLECHVFIGGTPLSQDRARLKKCHVAVGSPGRVKQLIELGYLSTTGVRLFVLDEADKLLEEGSFQEQINWIYSSLPVNKQMLALSATYPASLEEHLTRYMRDPAFVRMNPTDPGLIGLKQYYKLVKSHPLPHKIFEEKVQHLLELFGKVPFNQALVFSNLHSRAQHLADILTSKNLPAVCISGGLTQEQRMEAMSRLKQYKCRVLISTDLTSRGIDADKVNLVINLDVPQDWETYMHRIGRAGRFGTLGLAVTYCCFGEEENEMLAIAQKCNLDLHCLPDPIPPGLMEEPCDFAVCVENSPNVPEQMAFSGEAIQIQESVSEDFFSTRQSAPGKAGRKADKRKQVKNGTSRAEQLHGQDGGKTDGRVTEKTPSLGNNLESLSQADSGQMVSSLFNRQHQSLTDLEKKAQQDALPKIPSLPSFKVKRSHRSSILSFSKLVEDYEHFIRYGPGRTVEIRRQCAGLGSNGSEEVADEVCFQSSEDPRACQAQDSVEHLRDRTSSSSPGRPSSPSSESTMSNKDDSSETEEGGSENMEVTFSSNKETPVSNTAADKMPKTNTTEVCIPKNMDSEPARTSSTKYRSAPETPTVQYQDDAKSTHRVRESSVAKKQPGQHGYQRPSSKQAGRESRSASSVQDDYWTQYYKAWRMYHPPHLRAYQNWMNAYHMNLVYMQELMKR